MPILGQAPRVKNSYSTYYRTAVWKSMSLQYSDYSGGVVNRPVGPEASDVRFEGRHKPIPGDLTGKTTVLINMTWLPNVV